MGSTFVTGAAGKIKTAFGKKVDVPIYMQFVPGVVVAVVTARDSLRHRGSGNASINSIIAKPHIFEGTMPKTNETISEKYRYRPLLRGMVDVPSKGDPVLLCTIGRINYYLGPLNTQNDPNYNNDHLNIDEPVYKKNEDFEKDKESFGGTSKNFIQTDVTRLEKSVNHNLDWPVFPNSEYIRPIPPTFNEVHGDMMFEGRHGNSIRIGSRNKFPYLYISNGRNSESRTESLNDGGLISMTTYGNLSEHFGSSDIPFVEGMSGGGYGFTLASDININNKRSILLSSMLLNESTSPINDDLYLYNKSQIIVTSDRLTFNSKLNNMYLSSYKDIHIGAGRSLAISTNEDVIIESRKLYLGVEASKTFTSGEKEGQLKGEPMVLGNVLIEVMQEILKVIKESNGLCQGAPLPLVDTQNNPVATKIQPIEQKLDRILSQYYYIEPNGTQK